MSSNTRPSAQRARRVRATLAVGGLVAAALSATPAAASAPTRINAEYWGVTCVYALGDGQTAFLFGSGTTDGSEGGVGAFVEDADGMIIAEGSTPDVVLGDTFSATVDLDGAALSVVAGITRGETTTTTLRERSGNSWTKGTQTDTPLEVVPSAVLYDGRVVDLDGGGCSGEVTGFDVFTTEPAARVYRDDDFTSDICDVAGLPDAQVRLSGRLPDVYVEVVADHGGEDVEKAAGEVALRGGEGNLTTDVYDVFTGESRTTATIGVQLERAGQVVRLVEDGGGVIERRTVTPYDVLITVSFADGRRGTATCSGWATTTHLKLAPSRDGG